MIVIQFFVNDYLSVYRMFHHSQSSLETLLRLFEEYIRMASTCEGLGTGPGERFRVHSLTTRIETGQTMEERLDCKSTSLSALGFCIIAFATRTIFQLISISEQQDGRNLTENEFMKRIGES